MGDVKETRGRMKLLATFREPHQEGPAVRVYANKKRNRFAVHYGDQFADGLNFSKAGKELGLCLMHALSKATD
jgi:hypothetical protein